MGTRVSYWHVRPLKKKKKKTAPAPKRLGPSRCDPDVLANIWWGEGFFLFGFFFSFFQHHAAKHPCQQTSCMLVDEINFWPLTKTINRLLAWFKLRIHRLYMLFPEVSQQTEVALLPQYLVTSGMALWSGTYDTNESYKVNKENLIYIFLPHLENPGYL